jgi:hypothetical protein
MTHKLEQGIFLLHELRSTNPRDKVYCILGMVDDYADGEINITYILTVFQLYREVIRHILQKDESLEFLCDVYMSMSNPQHHLPT